jgi:hypothetical protein
VYGGAASGNHTFSVMLGPRVGRLVPSATVHSYAPDGTPLAWSLPFQLWGGAGAGCDSQSWGGACISCGSGYFHMEPSCVWGVLEYEGQDGGGAERWTPHRAGWKPGNKPGASLAEKLTAIAGEPPATGEPKGPRPSPSKPRDDRATGVSYRPSGWTCRIIFHV